MAQTMQEEEEMVSTAHTFLHTNHRRGQGTGYRGLGGGGSRGEVSDTYP